MPPTHAELVSFIDSLRRDAGAWRVNEDACTQEQRDELQTVAARPPRGLVIKKFGTRSVVGAYRLDDGLRTVLKYYYPRTMVKQLTYGIRGSRCLQSWVAGRVFRKLDIPTPEVLAMWEIRSGGGIMLRKSFLACLEADGIPLCDYLAENAEAPEKLERVAQHLRNAFDKMADYRIAHGDLKANNILVDARQDISFIDLDGVTLLDSENRWSKARIRDRQRFLANWKNSPPAAEIFHDVISPAP
jgi:tRNA A-37 threonylcarbamoyl transferase component Bud32